MGCWMWASTVPSGVGSLMFEAAARIGFTAGRGRTRGGAVGVIMCGRNTKLPLITF